MTSQVSAQVKPAWAGEDWLSRFVNLLIRTKPIYAVMKSQARRVMIKTAQKNDIAWKQNVRELEAAIAHTGPEQTLANISNPSITAYPSYYTKPFHAYDEGNLCWQAAFEAEPATYSIALRVWPNEPLTWQAAQARMRGSFFEVIDEVIDEYAPHPVKDILDMGCSVGISTRALHQHYVRKQPQPPRTVGLDLSPYMLSVAHLRNKDGSIAEWVHANAEATGLPSESFDVITLQSVLHELPRHITSVIFNEAKRLLRPGGCLAIFDNNPKSAVIQNLPPVLFTLMKSTEPWSDDFYTFDIEAALRDGGFENVVSAETDPRHRAIVARKS
ncbi:MAG: class I SAM-dependent methyltransferase [Cyanobacteria bacterium J06629_19]